MSIEIRERFKTEITPALMDELGLTNLMESPDLVKIVVNIGLGEALDNPKVLEAATEDVMRITGQRPIITRSSKSIANFKLREGRAIGVKVTLRGDKMWAFFDRLVNVALPRTRDFRGISPNSFDGRGNYTLGLREQLIFPEIDFDEIDKVRGMEITIVTTAQTDDQARRMLSMIGMPFRKEG